MGDRAVISGQYTLQELPTTSQTLVAVLELCQRPGSSDEELAHSIQLDPVLSASLLALSTAQLQPQKTELPLLERVVSRLGKSAVQAVTLDIARRLCRHPQAPFFQALSERLWHSTLVKAKLASAFAILGAYSNPSEAYLVGLLQGLGPLRVVAEATHKADILELESDQPAILSAGRRLFPEGPSAWIDEMVRQWGVPGSMADALRYQDRDPEAVADAHLLIRISNLVARLASAEQSQLNPWLEMAWRWFGIEPDLGREIVSQAHAEARQVGAELSIHGRREYSPQPLLALRNEVEDLLQIQAITAAVSADESAGVEPARILSRVLAQGTGCKKYRILAHDAVSHQLVGRTDGADVLQSGSEEADWHIGLKPARSVMAIAFDQGEARLLGAGSEPRSVADEQMLDMLGQTAALCLPVIVDPEWGLLIVAGGGHGQMLRLSNQPRYLQTLCSILARVLVGPGGTLSRTRAATRVGDTAGSGPREMAHELSNPLTVASNYLAILEHKLTQAGLHYDELAIAKEELQRASRLLADWQLPAKPESRGGKVDVNETLERLVKVYRTTLLEPRNISLVLERDEQRALADIDESALQQILRNLIGNAIDAVDDGGHILVKTSAEVFMDSGAFVEIVLIDDGPGLPDAVRANIYNPVESTKGGDHAGLGLSIAKSLIDRENGSIAFRSSAQGTRFQVYLPR